MLFPLFFLLLLLPLATGTGNAETTAAGVGCVPVPTPWPEQFHAVLLTNLTASSGRLELIDVYYDWPRGRSLNIVRSQLSGELLYNVEWVNGSSYLFGHSASSSSSSCTSTWHRVGVLTPDWIDDAVYVGRDTVDGFECHVWSHTFFVRYYEDVTTGRPVFWNFVGSLRHVLSFEVGGVPNQNSPKWQAPASCFIGSNADAGHEVQGKGNGADVTNSTIRFANAAARII